MCVLTFTITFNGILWCCSNANANTITKRYGNQILSFANNMHCSKPAEIFEQNETAINIVSVGVNAHTHSCMYACVCVLCVVCVNWSEFGIFFYKYNLDGCGMLDASIVCEREFCDIETKSQFAKAIHRIFSSTMLCVDDFKICKYNLN